MNRTSPTGRHTQRAIYEQALGAAHKSVWRAMNAADALGNEGACEDLRGILYCLGTLTSESLDGRKRNPRRQMSLDDCAYPSDSA